MSTFGDRTPLQAMLEAVEYVQYDYQLTDQETNVMLVTVLQYLVTIGDSETDRIQTEKYKADND